jgi:hypothetical protein
MDSMKKTISSILCLSLIAQLTIGGLYTRPAYADTNKKEVTAPDALIKVQMADAKALFGPNGPAVYDEKTGKITIRYNSTTSQALNDDEKKANSLSTYKRIEAFSARQKKIDALISESQNVRTSKDCVNCGTGKTADTVAEADLPPNAMCSAKEKAAIQIKKAKSSCLMNDIKNSLNLGAGASCIGDILTMFGKSMAKTGAAIIDGLTAVKDYAKTKMFSEQVALEKQATASAKMKSQMSDKNRALAKKSPELANRSIMDEFKHGISFLMENFIGLDIPMYSEIMACAKCGESVSAICKVVGVAGRDAIVNYLIGYAAGKAISGVIKIGARVAAKSGKMVAAGLERSVAGRALLKTGSVSVAWGAKQTAKIGSITMSAWTKFAATDVGKGAASLGKMGMKIVTFTDDAVEATVKGVKSVPKRLYIGTGRAETNTLAATARNAEIIARSPLEKIGGKVGDEIPGITPLSEVASSGVPLKIEVNTPKTPSMLKAEKSLLTVEKQMKRAPGSEGKFFDDIENASKVDAVQSGSHAIKIDGPPGYVKFEHAGKEISYQKFGFQNEKGILKVGDKTYLTEKGQIVRDVKTAEKNAIETLTSRDGGKADQLAVDNAKANLRANEGKIIDDVNATAKDGSFKAETPDGCGPGGKGVGNTIISRAL